MCNHNRQQSGADAGGGGFPGNVIAAGGVPMGGTMAAGTGSPGALVEAIDVPHDAQYPAPDATALPHFGQKLATGFSLGLPIWRSRVRPLAGWPEPTRILKVESIKTCWE